MTKRPARALARQQASRLAIMAEQRNDRTGSYRLLAVQAEGASPSRRPSA